MSGIHLLTESNAQDLMKNDDPFNLRKTKTRGMLHEDAPIPRTKANDAMRLELEELEKENVYLDQSQQSGFQPQNIPTVNSASASRSSSTHTILPKKSIKLTSHSNNLNNTNPIEASSTIASKQPKLKSKSTVSNSKATPRGPTNPKQAASRVLSQEYFELELNDDIAKRAVCEIISEETWSALTNAQKWQDTVEALTQIFEQVQSICENHSTNNIIFTNTHRNSFIFWFKSIPTFRSSNGSINKVLYQICTTLFDRDDQHALIAASLFSTISNDLFTRCAEKKNLNELLQLLRNMILASSPRYFSNLLSQFLMTCKHNKTSEHLLTFFLEICEEFSVESMDFTVLCSIAQSIFQSTYLLSRQKIIVQFLALFYTQLGREFLECLLKRLRDTLPSFNLKIDSFAHLDNPHSKSYQPKFVARGRNALRIAFDPNQLFPTFDISTAISDELFEKFRASHWKVRQESIEELSQIIQSNPRFSIGNPTFVNSVADLCNDANKNISLKALHIVSLLLSVVPKLQSKVREKLFDSLLNCVGDRKKELRTEALKVVEKWLSVVGLSTTASQLTRFLNNPLRAFSRRECLEVICAKCQYDFAIFLSKNNVIINSMHKFFGVSKTNALPATSTFYNATYENNEVVSLLLPATLDCLLDKNLEVRNFAEYLLFFARISVPFSTMVSIAQQKYKTSENLVLQPILERYKNISASNYEVLFERILSLNNSFFPFQDTKLQDSKPTEPISHPVTKPNETPATTTPRLLRTGAITSNKTPKTVESTSSMAPTIQPYLSFADMKAKKKRLAKDEKIIFHSHFHDMTSEEVKDLLDSMTPLLTPVTFTQLFSTVNASTDNYLIGSSAFGHHINFLETLKQALAEPASAQFVLTISDVACKYLRLVLSSQPSSQLVIAVFSFLQLLCSTLVTEKIKFTDADACSLIPTLRERILNSNIQKFRQSTQTIIALFSSAYSPSKMFKFVAEGFSHKNFRIVNECIELSATLYSTHKTGFCHGEELVALCAPFLGGDQSLRASSMTAIITVHKDGGDVLFWMRDCSEKERSMVEERIRRLKIESIRTYSVDSPVAPTANSSSSTSSSNNPLSMRSPLRLQSSEPSIVSIKSGISGSTPTPKASKCMVLEHSPVPRISISSSFPSISPSIGMPTISTPIKTTMQTPICTDGNAIPSLRGPSLFSPSRPLPVRVPALLASMTLDPSMSLSSLLALNVHVERQGCQDLIGNFETVLNCISVQIIRKREEESLEVEAGDDSRLISLLSAICNNPEGRKEIQQDILHKTFHSLFKSLSIWATLYSHQFLKPGASAVSYAPSILPTLLSQSPEFQQLYEGIQSVVLTLVTSFSLNSTLSILSTLLSHSIMTTFDYYYMQVLLSALALWKTKLESSAKVEIDRLSILTIINSLLASAKSPMIASTVICPFILASLESIVDAALPSGTTPSLVTELKNNFSSGAPIADIISKVRPTLVPAIGTSSTEPKANYQIISNESQILAPKASPIKSNSCTAEARTQGTEPQIEITDQSALDKKGLTVKTDSQEIERSPNAVMEKLRAKSSMPSPPQLPSFQTKNESESKPPPKPIQKPTVSKLPTLLLKKAMVSSAIRNPSIENREINAMDNISTKSAPSAAPESVQQSNASSNSYLDRFKAVQNSIKRPSINFPSQTLSSVLSSRTKLPQSFSLTPQLPTIPIEPETSGSVPSSSCIPNVAATSELMNPSSSEHVIDIKSESTDKSDREMAFDKFRARLKAKTSHSLLNKPTVRSDKAQLDEVVDASNNKNSNSNTILDVPAAYPESNSIPPLKSNLRLEILISNTPSESTIPHPSSSCLIEEKETVTSTNSPNHVTLFNPISSKHIELERPSQPLLAKIKKVETKPTSAISSLRKKLEELSQRQ